MRRSLPLLIAIALLALPRAAHASAMECQEWSATGLRENPTEAQLRCRWRAIGAGRFGLLSYMDLPVYQPKTPMPGTHVIGVPGHAAPRPGESYEAWEWRILRATFGPEARTTHRDLELLAPDMAPRIRHLEHMMRERGIPVRRLEGWRAPERQAYLFQQGRSRPGPLATGTLTSLHSVVDSLGRPAGRAVDYDVPARHLPVFHELVRLASLESYGEDSNDRGHVFLRDVAAVRETELMLLRLLPRVPEVTLATGLPVDDTLPVGGMAVLRRASLDFASEPFIARPAPRLARRAPAAGRGARYERPRSAWHAGVEADRSTDE